MHHSHDLMDIKTLQNDAIDLLRRLIQTQSFSTEEDNTAAIIHTWLTDRGVETKRYKNNIWATNQFFDPAKPSILLNSHHDTVKPHKGYTNDPYEPRIDGDILYGLGSNDAGGALVSLLSLFVHYYGQPNLKYNVVMAATAEEEIFGDYGLKCMIEKLPPIDFAIVGEPTEMQLAIAEKGLLVLDVTAQGVGGHAAHTNTVNAIHNAISDIEWFRTYQFEKTSDTLANVKMSVTQIQAGSQHNVVPAACHFVVDIRVNDCYTNKEVYDQVCKHVTSQVKARSFKHNSSSISADHPVVKAGKKLGRTTYGSPTASDQVHLSVPSLKLGPGKSTRSHTANEFILISEIHEGIELYINILKEIL